MANLEAFKAFYQNNPHYFKRAGEGAAHGALFPSHAQVHAYVRAQRGKRACDFGCGEGNDIERMWSADNEYVGLDVSQEALASARARFAPGNVAYEKVDFDAPLSYADGSFDIVTSFFVFEHLIDPARSLGGLIRILKPGGELFLITPNYGSPLKSAPPLGTPSKIKLLLKSGKIAAVMVRRMLYPRAPLSLTMIPLARLDLTGTWGPDFDATNEPWSWEIAACLRAHGFTVEVRTWEGDEYKTAPERLLSRFAAWPLISHWGPLCYVHAVKRAEEETPGSRAYPPAG